MQETATRTKTLERGQLGQPKRARERLPAPRFGTAPSERKIHTYLTGNLGREIVSGVYQPGSVLPNAEVMCARFSVSRTALREAYSVLGAKSLIVARPKVGTRVRPKSEWNMLDADVLAWHLQSGPTEDFVGDLYELRQMVEPPAARLAATRRSEPMLKQISEAYADMERRKDGTGDLIEADLRFHMGILEATGNHFLSALGGLIHASLQCTFRYSWAGAARIQDDRLHQHGAILKAIAERSADGAHSRMTELLRDSINDVREFLRSRGAKDKS